MAFEPGNKLGGRPKGSRNKRNLELEILAEKFQNPFELLMLFATGDWKALGYDNECYFSEGPEGATKMGYTISPEMRLSATKEACQYLYSKKKEEEVEDPHALVDITPEAEEQAALEALKYIQSKFPKLLSNG